MYKIPRIEKIKANGSNFPLKVQSNNIWPTDGMNKVASNDLSANIAIFPDIPDLRTDLYKKLYLSTQKYKTNPTTTKKDPKGISSLYKNVNHIISNTYAYRFPKSYGTSSLN